MYRLTLLKVVCTGRDEEGKFIRTGKVDRQMVGFPATLFRQPD